MKRWIMVLALVCSCGMVAFAQKATEASIIVFGEAKATKERIDKGATFIDGRFIRGPYTVTRQGNVILVNGQPAAHLKIEIAKEEAPEEDVAAPSADADAASDEEAVEADASEATDAETPEVTLPPTRTLTRAEKEAAAKEKADAEEAKKQAEKQEELKGKSKKEHTRDSYALSLGS